MLHITTISGFADLLYALQEFIFQIVPLSDPTSCIVVPLGFLFVVLLRPLEYSLQ